MEHVRKAFDLFLDSNRSSKYLKEEGGSYITETPEQPAGDAMDLS